MIEGLDEDVDGLEAVAARRDEIVSQIRDHAGTMARELALLQGGDYGQRAFSTKTGEWTLKYEAGDLQYLRFKGKAGRETYVVSTKQPPDPKDLAKAMDDYGAFVESYNDYVASLDGVLDGISTEFPEVDSTESVVVERDRIVQQIRDTTDRMAGELHRYNGTDYGSFASRVAGSRWELKWEGDRASYLRVGGEGGVYLVSQYSPPSARDVRSLADDFHGFVEAFNDHVDELDVSLSKIDL